MATAPGTVRVTDGADGLNGSHHEAFGEALARTVAVLGDADLPFAIVGGVASAGYGRARWTKDIDVFLRPEDADPALDALAADGFDVERTNPAWIYKAFRDGVQVDVIFKGKGGIFFDERMAERVRTVSLVGVDAAGDRAGGPRRPQGPEPRRGVAPPLARRPRRPGVGRPRLGLPARAGPLRPQPGPRPPALLALGGRARARVGDQPAPRRWSSSAWS